MFFFFAGSVVAVGAIVAVCVWGGGGVWGVCAGGFAVTQLCALAMYTRFIPSGTSKVPCLSQRCCALGEQSSDRTEEWRGRKGDFLIEPRGA